MLGACPSERPGYPPHVRPSPEELQAAAGRRVPDVVGPDLRVLFCGINPSLWSAAVGHHFARPGNRFWKVLHGAGFTDRVLDPTEDDELLAAGLGVTNLVPRATAAAAELSADELRRGGVRLARTVGRWRPRAVAVVGLQAYRTAFGRPRAGIGRQEDLAGAQVWALPNPSGLQARYGLDEMVAAYAELRRATEPAG